MSLSYSILRLYIRLGMQKFTPSFQIGNAQLSSDSAVGFVFMIWQRAEKRLTVYMRCRLCAAALMC